MLEGLLHSWKPCYDVLTESNFDLLPSQRSSLEAYPGMA